MNGILSGLLAAAAGLALTAASTPASACVRHEVGAAGVFGDGAFTYDHAVVPAGSKIRVRAAYTGRHKTSVTLRVSGLLPRRMYGAHAHQSACGPLPAAAGAHFQRVVDPVQPSVDPAYANRRNEIWLDFTTDRNGNGRARSVVNWTFDSSRAASVVIHDHHTATAPGQAGTAGARHGCLSVPF